jgi:hypothetical protein
MNMGALKRQIAERKQAARDKEYEERARFIIDVLGSEVVKRDGGREWISGKYSDRDFEIVLESTEFMFDESSSVNISYKTNAVFAETDCEIRTYIPGAWEEAFERLNRRASKKQPNLAVKLQEERKLHRRITLTAMAKQFGL